MIMHHVVGSIASVSFLSPSLFAWHVLFTIIPIIGYCMDLVGTLFVHGQQVFLGTMIVSIALAGVLMSCKYGEIKVCRGVSVARQRREDVTAIYGLGFLYLVRNWHAFDPYVIPFGLCMVKNFAADILTLPGFYIHRGVLMEGFGVYACREPRCKYMTYIPVYVPVVKASTCRTSL